MVTAGAGVAGGLGAGTQSNSGAAPGGQADLDVLLFLQSTFESGGYATEGCACQTGRSKNDTRISIPASGLQTGGIGLAQLLLLSLHSFHHCGQKLQALQKIRPLKGMELVLLPLALQHVPHCSHHILQVSKVQQIGQLLPAPGWFLPAPPHYFDNLPQRPHHQPQLVRTIRPVQLLPAPQGALVPLHKSRNPLQQPLQ